MRTRSGGTVAASEFLLQLGGQDAKELPRRDYADTLKLLREVAGVAGDNVSRPALQSALKNRVVVGIASDLELPLGVDNNSRIPNRPQGACNSSWVESEAGPAQYVLVLFEKGVGQNQREPSRQGRINE